MNNFSLHWKVVNDLTKTFQEVKTKVGETIHVKLISRKNENISDMRHVPGFSGNDGSLYECEDTVIVEQEGNGRFKAANYRYGDSPKDTAMDNDYFDFSRIK